MYDDYFEDFHERIFYVGGAVVDEVLQSTVPTQVISL